MLVKTTKFGKVLCFGHYMKTATEHMFAERGFGICQIPEEADYICYLGGDDIHPNLYGQKLLEGTTWPNVHQDEKDIAVFNLAVNNKVLLGICRGGQLLNALNGGSMWQDVDNHGSGFHNITDMKTGNYFPVNTLHHQQMVIGDGGELLAFSTVSNNKIADGTTWRRKQGETDEKDAEAIFYSKTNSLCYQPHPEFAHAPTRKYFFELIERYALAF